MIRQQLLCGFFASMGVKFIDGNGEDVLDDSDNDGSEQD